MNQIEIKGGSPTPGDKPIRSADEDLMYIHSRCCNAHWELVSDPATGGWDVRCEKCGTPAGPSIKVTGPKLDNHCEVCEDCKCRIHDGSVAESADAQDSKSCSCNGSEGSTPSGATKLGPTGEYPDGKISEDDAGELRLGLGVSQELKQVALEFGTEISWFALPKEEAIRFGQSIVDAANSIKD